MIPGEFELALRAGKFLNPRLQAIFQLVVALRARSSSSSFIDFFYFLAKALSLVLQNVDELSKRVVILNGSVDPTIYKSMAGIGKCLPFIPVAYFKFFHFRVIHEDLIG